MNSKHKKEKGGTKRMLTNQVCLRCNVNTHNIPNVSYPFFSSLAIPRRLYHLDKPTTPKSSQHQHHEVPDASTNPETPKSSQLQCHADPNALTNHRTPKPSRRQHRNAPNASTNAEMPTVYLKTCLETFCMLCVAR